ncbi:MAG: hypothetical protein JNM93_12865 [Bacteriovoracaceae bacterium]|nr:hypothetical protein [Bacteriovoracaceae bacterium]
MKNLIFLFLFSACTFFSDKVQTEKANELDYKRNEKTYCKVPTSDTVVVGSNELIQSLFLNFLKDLKQQEIQLSFVETSVLWSLLQINLRPDLSSPTARFQVIYQNGSKPVYLDYSPQQKSKNTYAFLYGLNDILKKNSPQKSLRQLNQLLDLYFPDQMYVSEELASFFKSNELALTNLEWAKTPFTRGDEMLKKGERLPKIRFENLNRLLEQTTTDNIKISTQLYNKKMPNDLNMNCNFEVSVYEKSLFLISKNDVQGNMFGLSKGKAFFLATTNQDISELKNIPESFFFDGNPKTRMPAVCQFEQSKQYSTWLVANQSRDPGQHLYHLYQYGVKNIHSTEDMTSILKFSRHLFLTDPLRLVFESQRGSKQQLDELLKLNVPIYHTFTLGNVWGHIQFNNGIRQFFVDERNLGYLSCQ